MKLHALTTIYTDFETAWSNEYTLSKMPTQAYVLDERFRAHGCCIAINDGPIKWFSHDVLKPVFKALDTKYPRSIWVNQNSLFDQTIFSLRYRIHPFLIADTAAMSRALIGPILRRHGLEDISKLLLNRSKGKELILSKGVWDLKEAGIEEQIAGYCYVDVDLMRENYKILCPYFPASELLVMTWVTQMMTQPQFAFDGDMLWQYYHEVVDRKEGLLRELGIDKKDLMSNDKFATLLCSFGVDPPLKLNKNNETKYAFAKTDQGLKDLLEHEDPDVQALVSARLEVKTTIEETRSKRYAELAKYDRICVPLAYSGAIPTHRLSGRDKLNFQNLKRGGRLRDSIIAPDGYEFIVTDLSQIELRLTLWLTGHHDKVQILANGGDLYSELATELYGVEVTKEKAKEDKRIAEMRHVGKETTLGSGYGMGAAKCQVYLAGKGVQVTPDFAKAAIKLYRNKYFGVPRLWKDLELCFLNLLNLVNNWRADGGAFDAGADLGEEIYDFGGYSCPFGVDPLFYSPAIKLPNGLYIKYPELTIQDRQWTYKEGNEKRNIWGGHFLENLCQSLARCIIMEKAVEVHKRLPVVLQVHDEIVMLAPTEQIDELKEWVQQIMVKPVSWLPSLPIGSETTNAKRYGDAK